MIFESKNFGIYSIILCGLGIVLFILILALTENAGEILSDKSVFSTLLFLEVAGALLGIICRSSVKGKIGVGLAVATCLLFILFAPPINLSPTPLKGDQDQPLRIRFRRIRRFY